MPKSVDTYMVVAPNGSITFDFDGHISAAGIDIIAGDSSLPPDDRKIIWHADTLTGAHVAELRAYDQFGNSFLELESLGRGITGPASAKLEALHGAGGNAKASVQVGSVNPNPSTSGAVILASAGAQQATILDGNNGSTFLKQTFAANRSIQWGNKSFTWPGATAVQNFVIAHALGVAPVSIQITQANNNTTCTYRAYATSSTTFTVDVLSVGGVGIGAGVADNFWWTLIG